VNRRNRRRRPRGHVEVFVMKSGAVAHNFLGLTDRESSWVHGLSAGRADSMNTFRATLAFALSDDNRVRLSRTLQCSAPVTFF
jgi:hypothetical protein